MLHKNTLKFLRDIKSHNTREWFEKNREKYEEAKIDFDTFIAALLKEVSKFDPDIKELESKNCTFRQYRDVRFSKDKRPYKINMGAYINRGGKKSLFGGYYFHVEPDDHSFTGGGLWVPMAPELKKVRQEIDYCYDEFKSIVEAPKFKKVFGGLRVNDEMKLKKIPKGYPIDHPAIEFLKHKSFVAMKQVTDQELTSSSLLKNTVNIYKTLKPLLDFVNRSIE
ncbi:MAG: DUF2461 domain-containing protein [Ginsengibacter sp.]